MKILPQDAIYAVESPGSKKIPGMYDEFGVRWTYIPMNENGIDVDSLRAKGGFSDKNFIPPCAEKYIVADYYFDGNESGFFSLWFLHCGKCFWMAWNRNFCNVGNWIKRLSGYHGVCNVVRIPFGHWQLYSRSVICFCGPKN